MEKIFKLMEEYEELLERRYGGYIMLYLELYSDESGNLCLSRGTKEPKKLTTFADFKELSKRLKRKIKRLEKKLYGN